jgi:hypothetical protein
MSLEDIKARLAKATAKDSTVADFREFMDRAPNDVVNLIAAYEMLKIAVESSDNMIKAALARAEEILK